jgi:hypothetical protein
MSLSARSWSYDNFKTYPMMQLPETRIERQIVDGVEKDVQVQVMQPTKPLFLFAEKEVSPTHR